MGIQKSKIANIKSVRSGFAVSHHVIRKSKASIDPLQSGEKKTSKNGRGIDPSRFMNRKQRKAWKRLSPQKRKHYILMAQKEAGREHAKKGVAVKERNTVLSQKGNMVDPEVARQLVGWKTKESSNGVMIRTRKILQARIDKKRRYGNTVSANSGTYHSSTSRELTNQISVKEVGQQSLQESGMQGNGYLGSGYTSSPANGSVELKPIAGIVVKEDPGESSVVNTANLVFDSAASFEEGAVSSTGAVAIIAKKAADRFKENLKRKTWGDQSRRERFRLEQALNASNSYSTKEKAGAVTVGAIISMVIQAAVQMVSSIVTILSMILIPIAIIAMIISLTLSLVSSISAVVEETDSYYMGGGMELVEVAIRELGTKENPDGTTKYGDYVGIGKANWCQAFVSWCANECGFVEQNIIPKTGACETARQWFSQRNEYQPSGNYEPMVGDIIFFRHGSETVSHHVGIVEYAENGIVHTIEGNSGGVVKRREYPMKADRIMGYGTPAYVDEGYGEFGSGQEFLKTIKKIGDTILKDGDWKYSNSGVKGNFTEARRASRHVTNCAHAISMCMQEFGTLKKNQHFYADWNGSILCSNSTRKQINKYYDIINVGGKHNADGVKLEPGDICVWNIHVNVYAGNQGGKKVWYDFSKNCISDKSPDSGTYIKYIRKGKIGQTLYKVLRLKDQESYGSGKQYIIPKGLGTTYTYMGWATIHDWPTRQNYLRKRSGEHYDSHGFAIVNGRYVIACTTTFGKVGDYIDFVLDNGKVIHGIMGDEKNQSDPGCNKWGHDDGHSVVEFVVNKSMWYGHLDNTDITRFHPEWKSRVKMGVNLGKNYFDD